MTTKEKTILFANMRAAEYTAFSGTFTDKKMISDAAAEFFTLWNLAKQLRAAKEYDAMTAAEKDDIFTAYFGGDYS